MFLLNNIFNYSEKGKLLINLISTTTCLFVSINIILSIAEIIELVTYLFFTEQSKLREKATLIPPL